MAVISGGTTLIDNGALDAGVPTGSLILLSTQTASASANISFTTGLDSTYDSYVFKFIDIHPATDGVLFTFNMSTDSGSNYNVTKTTTFFRARHFEDGTNGAVDYRTGNDLAQSTAFQELINAIGNGNDASCSGTLTIFNPASTTFVKHFISTFNNYLKDTPDIGTNNVFVAGYGNTTSAINAIQFKMSSGNIDDGIIKLYGVKKS
jgi:hypothetical protein